MSSASKGRLGRKELGRKGLGLALLASLTTATAQGLPLQVTAQILPGRVILDAGGGPKTFSCLRTGEIGSTLKRGNATLNVAGASLLLTLDAESGTIRFEAEQATPQRAGVTRLTPNLAPDQIRLWCQSGQVQSLIGQQIDVQTR